MPAKKKVDSAAAVEEPVIAVKQKREKKTSKHKVVAVITADGIQGTFQNETKRPLIAHLPIHSSEIQFNDQPFVYDPRPPGAFEAFDASEIDPFATEASYENAPKESVEEIHTEIKTQQSNQSHTQSSQNQNQSQSQKQQQRKEYGPSTLLVQFANTKQTHELPEQSDLACFWCCETFESRPCVIPIRVIESVWQVYGNFCCPQCAMAYLMSEILDTHMRWERIALLNRLYAKNVNGRLYPAPSRESLERFGGPVSIEDFRNMCEGQKIRVDIHMPPMVSILASMDTKPIDFYETPLRNTFASPYQYTPTIVNETTNGLKLKRNKPLKDKESTLDACLNITRA
jgi:hypothetical protein